MGGGGGDTVTTTNTGLGDEQYETLSANQTQMQADMAAQQVANEAALATQNATMQASINAANASAAASAGAAQAASSANSGRFDRLDTSVGGVDTNVTTGFATIEDLLGQYNAGQTAGFDQVANRFDTVDTATDNIQGSVDQGFVDQTQGFSDAQVNRTANAAANTANFAAAGEAMNQGFVDTSNQMTQTQANVLGGQGELQTNLDTMSDTADIYAAQSLENQAGLQQGQDSFVSSFDDYTERYGEDNQLATQSRSDLFEAQANQTDSLRKDIGDYSQASSTGQTGISQQVQKLDKQFAEGLAGLDAGQITQARDLALVASNQTNLNMDMRQNFSQLGAAFDNNGALIPSSVDPQGNTITRSVDDMGNLLLNTYNTIGNALGSKSINMRESLQQLSNLQNVQGANANMGGTSPATSSVPSGGFAAPYSTTG